MLVMVNLCYVMSMVVRILGTEFIGRFIGPILFVSVPHSYSKLQNKWDF
jgi:hypothetical protein